MFRSVRFAIEVQRGAPAKVEVLESGEISIRKVCKWMVPYTEDERKKLEVRTRVGITSRILI